jgi:hypothetical protein
MVPHLLHHLHHHLLHHLHHHQHLNPIQIKVKLLSQQDSGTYLSLR